MLCEQQESGKFVLILFFVDLDNFKVVNDISGYFVGDEFLWQVVNCFLSVSKGGVVLVWFGGDEFVVIGQFVLEWVVIVFVEELVKVICKLFWVGNWDFVIGVMVGYICVCQFQDMFGDLMCKVDIVFYKVKESGWNCVLVFVDEMEIEVCECCELEVDFREVFENGRFWVEF